MAPDKLADLFGIGYERRVLLYRCRFTFRQGLDIANGGYRLYRNIGPPVEQHRLAIIDPAQFSILKDHRLLPCYYRKAIV